MYDELEKPQGESPETPESSELLADTAKSSNAKPVALKEDDEFDKEHALKTIRAQREENKQLKNDLKELEMLRAEKRTREEAELTELEKAQKRIADLEAQNAETQKFLWRSQAATEANLPSIFADRVQGTTLEEMKADALKLAEALPKSKTNPALNPTNPQNGDNKKNLQELKEQIFGTHGSYFDLDSIMAQGGGVMDMVTKTKPSKDES